MPAAASRTRIGAKIRRARVAPARREIPPTKVADAAPEGKTSVVPTVSVFYGLNIRDK